MSATAGTSSDDDDFQFESGNVGSKRYPVHDCCEFEDAESLRKLIFVPQDDSSEQHSDDSESESDHSSAEDENADDSSSSSDDNDSLAAARAAAIGHSPRLPANVKLAMARMGATAAVAAGISAHAVPSVENQHDESEEKGEPDVYSDTLAKGVSVERKGPLNAKVPATTEGVTSSNGGAPDVGVTGAALKPGTAGLSHLKENDLGAPTSMDVSDQAVHDEPSNQDAGIPTNPQTKGRGKPVSLPPIDSSKPTKKHRKKSAKKARKPSYYCPYDLNERDEDENTSLHVAIHARKLEHVKLLLKAGASPNKKCDGSSPVHTAISIGAVPMQAEFAFDCVVALGEHEVDLSAKDDAMHTPLYLACVMNLARVVSYILDDSEGLSTLNARADRSGGRALHAAAKFDTPPARGLAGSPRSAGEQARMSGGHHHPDGTITRSGHHIPGAHTSPDASAGKESIIHGAKVGVKPETAAVLTQILISTPGIEIDAPNSYGQTPLHIACSRGNWTVVRLLLRSGANPLIADRRGFTPGQLAHKRGMPIPVDLIPALGDALASSIGAPLRDLIVDPDSTTLVISHELCMLHRSCPPIRRDSNSEPPPENVRRLHVLVNEQDGILRGGEFGRCAWEGDARRAAMSDVLKVHEYNYIESISLLCSSIPDHPSAVAHLDADTAISRWSFEAALRAAGSVCEAVDRVVNGDYRNAFCAIRPPGHHAGPRGIVRCANDPEGGSHGFCLLNNVAIGAAYARSMYRNDGIRKIAIVDFDVHHGNGTEEVIRQLVPNVEKSVVRTPFATGELSASKYRPWLDETDVNDVFFASTHGYGPRGLEFVDHPQQGGWFYPASGKTHIADAIVNPSLVETPNLQDFLLTQSWTRMGEESRANCCKIINCGLGLPRPDAIPGMQRLELRDTYRRKILPHLRDFDPDIIFISAGFDAHKRDTMNFGYVGMVEDDYEWITEQVVKIANTCCNGRIVSVLEGGYKIHGGIVSPFARSVASHVRALVDGGCSRELYDPEDGNWESQFERHVVEERERKRQQKIYRLSRMAELSRRQMYETRVGTVKQQEVDELIKEPLKDHCIPEQSLVSEEPTRKRRRNQVDYRELYEQMKREGFAG